LKSKEVAVMYLQSRPENGGYAGFFVITAKDQNTIEFVEQANIQTEDSKYSRLVLQERNGITYIATDLILKNSNTTKDELLKLLDEHSQDNMWKGHVKFGFRCKEISSHQTRPQS
jgi:lipopolysaccharide export LptBFGC system permease protein LptF